MPTINLREHYPDAHPEDFFVEVSEEVHKSFLQSGSGQVPKGSVGTGETEAAEFAW